MFVPHLVLAYSTLSDDFDNNRLDPSKWISFGAGGPTINEINQRLEITIPADSTNPTDLPGFVGEYVSACVLTGDFDIQVDYQLLIWPAENGVRMGISTGSTESAEIIRMSCGPNDQSYSCNAAPELYLTNPNRQVMETDDISGKLRLARVGNETTSYYFDSAEGWKLLSSSTQINNVHMYLYAFSTNGGPFGYNFGDQEVKVAFDNLIVKGKSICRDRYNPANPAVF